MKRVQKSTADSPAADSAVTSFEIPSEGIYVVKKVPTLFARNWEGDRLVTPEVNPDCQWVIDSEGIATEKIDGTPILVYKSSLYKRYDKKPERTAPEDFIPTDTVDAVTGRVLGWLPVTDGPEDKWVHQAVQYEKEQGVWTEEMTDGTYELVGPKVNGNPHRLAVHRLIQHGMVELSGVPRDYEGLKAYLTTANIEGIVWHASDGRMAKLKARDLGIKWPA